MQLLAGLFTMLSAFHPEKDTLPVNIDTTWLTLQQIVYSASRLPEQLRYSPVSIEQLSRKDLNRVAAPSFYDALESLKGVQVITPSLGFKVINTRGFANTTNVRFTQMVDGMDVQAPHIGSPIGNSLGPSDLDIESVELIPGNASALYGMNTINGLANFSTKNAFTDPGVQVQQKTAVNHIHDHNSSSKIFSETSLRWAHIISSKFAFKVNGTFSRGYDWIADDHNDLNASANSSTSLSGNDNPAIDPVNGYGNESANRKTLSLNGKNYVVARTGYFEKEVSDYHLQNIKADAALHYKGRNGTELIYTYRMALLNSIYQRANRFRLEDYLVQQHGLNFRSHSFTARVYLNRENTGQSYNLRSTAENIDRGFKSDNNWYSDYTNAFNTAIQNGEPVTAAHHVARSVADDGRPLAGSSAFQQGIDRVTDINNWDIGSALRVKASLLHAEIQENLSAQIKQWFEKSTAEVLIGADHRTYFISPDGNYFINPVKSDPFQLLSYSKTGGFISVTQPVLNRRLQLGATLRADKNDYFPLQATTRFSAVYSSNTRNSFRISYQSGNRYPSIFEAFSNVNSGGVKRVGGLKVMSDGIFENSYLRTSIDAFIAAVIKDVNTSGLTKAEALQKNQGLLQKNTYTYLKPENIHSFETGYKGVLLNSHLILDVDFYYNRYKNFIAQVEVNIPRNSSPDSLLYSLNDKTNQDRYRMWTNSQSVVFNYGGSAGATWRFDKGYNINGNLSYARLDKKNHNDGLEDGFNTPQWLTRMTISNDHLYKNFGATITGKWQSSYYWQSFLVNGNVPAFFTMDAQISYICNKMPVKLQAGASNVLNQYNVTFLGGPAVGGFYYTTISCGIK